MMDEDGSRNDTVPWWQTLSHPQVRSLAWALGSPSLMGPLEEMDVVSSSECARYLEDAREWLHGLDAAPEALLAKLKQLKGRQVGLYFEELIAFWLEHQSGHEIVGRNVQVKDAGRTLGAFDFILNGPTGLVEHWEITVKFYLQKRPSSSWEAWVGPNAKDRLDLKMNRMAGHQLPLSMAESGKVTLRQQGISGDVKRRAWTKGIFFQPWQGEARIPKGANKNNVTGVWFRQSDALEFARQYPSSHFMRRQKPDWLAPISGVSSGGVPSETWAKELATTNLQRSLMHSRLARTDQNTWQEQERLFVVSDDWPGFASV